MHLILKFFLLREVKKFHMKSNQYPWGYKTKCKITLIYFQFCLKQKHVFVFIEKLYLKSKFFPLV